MNIFISQGRLSRRWMMDKLSSSDFTTLFFFFSSASDVALLVVLRVVGTEFDAYEYVQQ